MASPHVLKHAPYCLRGCFGSEFASAYRTGKAEMANCLLGQLRLSQHETYEVIEELERSGALRFEFPKPETRHAPPDPNRDTPLKSGVWRIDT